MTFELLAELFLAIHDNSWDALELKPLQSCGIHISDCSWTLDKYQLLLKPQTLDDNRLLYGLTQVLTYRDEDH